MAYRIIIDRDEFKSQISSGMTEKALAEYYNCSLDTIRNRKRAYNLFGVSPNCATRKTTIEGKKVCRSCDTEKDYSEYFSNGKTPIGTQKYKPTCKLCEVTLAYTKKLNLKLKILNDLNIPYECSICGYKKNHAALCFHHKFKEKNFDIGSIASIGYEKLKYEISICDILCSNCHHELHNKDKVIAIM